jgi:hypothetical protein
MGKFTAIKAALCVVAAIASTSAFAERLWPNTRPTGDMCLSGGELSDAPLNNALRRLGSGWAIFVEASRDAAQNYPLSEFPDPVSGLVDAERRAQFEEEGAHFESAYYLTFLFLPPAEEAARAEALLYEGRSRDEGADAHEILKGFIDRTDRVLQLIEGFAAAWLAHKGLDWAAELLRPPAPDLPASIWEDIP